MPSLFRDITSLQRIAASIADSQLERMPALRSRGRLQRIEDAVWNLTYLGEAVELGEPVLFENFISWSKVTLGSRGIEPGELIASLEQIRATLRLERDQESAASAINVVEHVLHLIPSMPDMTPTFIGAASGLDEIARHYLDAILVARRFEADALLQWTLNAGTSISDLYLRVFEPVQHEVGRLWQMNRISVAQEHFCTAAVQRSMSQLYATLFTGTPGRKRVVAACAGGELHEVGLRMVTDLLEADGWDTVYLGANVPAESIVRTVAERPTALIAISTTITPHLRELVSIIEALRSRPETSHVPILVGGYPFRLSKTLVKRIGADGWAANAIGAVQRANELALALDGVREDASAGTMAVRHAEGVQPDAGSIDLWTELAQINNDLSTTQRQLAKSNAELSWLNEQKNQLLGMAAHDLRNPLAAVLAYSHFVSIDESLAPELQRMLGRIRANVETMLGIVEDVLDFSAIESGTVRLDRSELDVAELVEEILETNGLMADRKSIRLESSVAPDVAPLLADRRKLVQVLNNLVTNAIKFSHPGSSVTIAAGPVAEGGTWISVNDRGMGMSIDQTARLFEPFGRVGVEATGGEKSTGLGLAIVKRIVEAHLGRVEVKSSPGVGTTFRVVLP